LGLPPLAGREVRRFQEKRLRFLAGFRHST
jgi:hypothetical protein